MALDDGPVQSVSLPKDALFKVEYSLWQDPLLSVLLQIDPCAFQIGIWGSEDRNK